MRKNRSDVEEIDFTKNRKLLFWSDLTDMKSIVDRFAKAHPLGGMMANGALEAMQGTGMLGREPRDWITDKVARDMRVQFGRVLAAGKKGISYMGHAQCRICGIELGCADLYGHGFQWPEKSEHYVLEHDVWTPECNALFMDACL